jgi:hypothetical protein
MRDLALQAAGVLAILVAIAHGAIGELRVFARNRAAMDAEPAAGGVASQPIHWIGIGLLLIAAPLLGSQVAPPMGYAAVGNAVATRGRHVGWCLMSGVVALALMGL